MYINPYECVGKQDGEWLRANFHTHAGTGPDTCGKHDLEEVIRRYSEAKYQVLTISNHDIFTDTVALGAKYGLVMLNGVEFSPRKHMLCIQVQSLIASDSDQAVIDETNRQGGFAVFCHPRWIDGNYWPVDELLSLSGAVGLEVYNSVIDRMSGMGLATAVWDEALSRGHLLWGFGHDDFHYFHDMARSWNMIYAPKQAADVAAAVRAGAFYVSTGLVLKSFAFANNEIAVTAGAMNGFDMDVMYTFVGKNGKVLQESVGREAVYRLRGDEPYVRVVASVAHGAHLWTQPVYDAEKIWPR